MGNVCRRLTAASWGAILASLGSWLSIVGFGFAYAQFVQTPFELSDSVHLDEADSTTRAHLERVKAYIADGQWDEAVETLRQVMETQGGKVIGITPARYVSLADYCHLQISALPASALELYRGRVDPQAAKAYEDAIAAKDMRALQAIVSQMFCSSWGDDALWSLAELALERGDYTAARGYLETLIQQPPSQVDADQFRHATEKAGLPPAEFELLTKWYERDTTADPPVYRLRTDKLPTDAEAAELLRTWINLQMPGTRLAYPGTAIPLADIRARLVLVSILAGDLIRAKAELAAFTRLHPDASGQLAGRSTNFAKGLAALLTTAENWSKPKPSTDWPTFAGNFRRNEVAAVIKEIGPALWPPIDLGEPLTAELGASRAFSYKRVGEDANALLSYHPIVANDLLHYANHRYVFAFNLQSGKPAWPGDPTKPPGVIYDNETLETQTVRAHRGMGVPRYTLTVHNQRLYARMGSQVTSRPVEAFERQPGYLVCLDIAAQGRLVWKIAPEEDRWAFEGAPVVDGADVYVAMRRSDVRPQAFVACFDAETGRQRWRTMICSAETPSGGQSEEITHNLLTLNEGVLYFNTNLGAVAAVSADTGRIRWISLYPRAGRGADGVDRRAAHFYRDLNPCVFNQGLVYVAPSDCESIFALDAVTGQVARDAFGGRGTRIGGNRDQVWESNLVDDAIHLVGAADGYVIASGEQLWWFDARGGKVLARWPDTSPLGMGRGLIAGDQLLWTTRDALYTIDLILPTDARNRMPLIRRPPMQLTSTYGATGGNLIIAQNKLLLTTANKLYGFELRREAPKKPD